MKQMDNTTIPARKVALPWNKEASALETKPLMEHIKDLRRTLMICIGSVTVIFLILFLGFSKELVSLMTRPILGLNIQIVYTGVPEAFAAQMKLSIIASILVSSPIILTAVWFFIKPAFQPKGQVMAAVMLILCLALFLSGVYFAYSYVFYLAVNFFIDAGVGLAQPMISLGKYISFLFGFLLPFGVAFQLPLVIVILSKLGFVTTKALTKARKFVVFGIFIMAAILTPPDVVSQVMLGVPLWVLFEVGVLLSRVIKPKN